jgi:leucyl-tRNA synthetase
MRNRYIDLVSTSYPNLDIKSLSKQIDKSESKKAMPFVNALKRRLDAGEAKEVVLNRELAFDELSTLRAMIPGLMVTIQKCEGVEIVTVAEGGKEGIVDGSGEVRKELPPAALGAEPGSPGFAFENVEGLVVR